MEEALREHALRLTALETGAKVDEVRQQNIASRLDGIEDTLKWLVRLVLTGLIGGMLAFLIKGGFAI